MTLLAHPTPPHTTPPPTEFNVHSMMQTVTTLASFSHVRQPKLVRNYQSQASSTNSKQLGTPQVVICIHVLWQKQNLPPSYFGQKIVWFWLFSKVSPFFPMVFPWVFCIFPPAFQICWSSMVMRRAVTKFAKPRAQCSDRLGQPRAASPGLLQWGFHM